MPPSPYSQLINRTWKYIRVAPSGTQAGAGRAPRRTRQGIRGLRSGERESMDMCISKPEAASIYASFRSTWLFERGRDGGVDLAQERPVLVIGVDIRVHVHGIADARR